MAALSRGGRRSAWWLAVGAFAALSSTAVARAADSDDDDDAEEKAAKTEAGKPGGDACIDEDVKADLFAKRKQRTSRERLFQQTNRHELSLRFGYYESDTFDGAYTTHLGDIPGVSRVPGVRSVPMTGFWGFSYGYHMTEDFAVEASAALTRLASHGGPELERTFAVLEGKPRRQLMFDAALVYSLAHAKMRFGGAITHFDFFLLAGGGVVDSAVSSGIAGTGGFGLKFFLGKAYAVRLDLRDHIFRQQLLAESFLVNDISATLGFSLYLPMRE
jgi:outer membrane beta-barrel protein